MKKKKKKKTTYTSSRRDGPPRPAVCDRANGHAKASASPFPSLRYSAVACWWGVGVPFLANEREGDEVHAYSMPRSTSGMAVSIDSELVTLPSSPGLRSTLYRGSRLLKGSSFALPPASGAASAPESLDCWARPRRSFMFSSMYANLHQGKHKSPFLFFTERGKKKSHTHMLVYIKCVRLLRKVVSAHSAPHLGSFVG